MTWVVLDSNVYVSALIFGGNPRRVLELVEGKLFEVSVSKPIRAEVERILAEKFSWHKDRINDAAAYLWTLAHSINPQRSPTALTQTTTGYSNVPWRLTPG